MERDFVQAASTADVGVACVSLTCQSQSATGDPTYVLVQSVAEDGCGSLKSVKDDRDIQLVDARPSDADGPLLVELANRVASKLAELQLGRTDN